MSNDQVLSRALHEFCVVQYLHSSYLPMRFSNHGFHYHREKRCGYDIC